MSVDVDKKRYELQLEVVETLERADYNGIAICPTGLGKALILIECLKNISPRGRVWYLSDSQLNRDSTFKNELIKWGAEEWIDRIEFYCYQTAFKLKDEEVELCLADELDVVAEAYSRSCLLNKFEHFIGVTATLPPEKRKLVEKIRPVVYEIGLQEIEDQGLLNKSRYFEVNYMLTPKENKKYLEFNQQFVRLLQDSKKNTQELEFLKIRRGQFLAGLESSAKVCKRLVNELIKEGKKVLIFCNLSVQADKVCENSYHSKSVNNMLTDFNEDKIKLLSVVSKIDRGVNLGVDSGGVFSPVGALILESPNRSATKFLQRSGRGRRLQVHQTLDVYLLIAHYRNFRGQSLPTVVKRWVNNATKSINYKPIQYKFNET